MTSAARQTADRLADTLVWVLALALLAADVAACWALYKISGMF